MSSSINLLASMAQDRHAERYRAARHGQQAAALEQARRGRRPVEATRRRAGWILVGLGLRLVTGGDRAAAQRARLIGQ